MTSGLVNASLSLPEWQAVKMIFFAPCELWNLAVFSDFYRFAATQPQFTDVCLCFRQEVPRISPAIMLQSLSSQGRQGIWISSISKKITLHRQHSLLSIFFAIVLTTMWNFQKLPGYTFYGELMLYVFLLTFFFHCLLIFTLVAASISHFLTAAIKFSCFSSNKIGLLCFLSLSLALPLLSALM